MRREKDIANELCILLAEWTGRMKDWADKYECARNRWLFESAARKIEILAGEQGSKNAILDKMLAVISGLLHHGSMISRGTPDELVSEVTVKKENELRAIMDSCFSSLDDLEVTMIVQNAEKSSASDQNADDRNSLEMKMASVKDIFMDIVKCADYAGLDMEGCGISYCEPDDIETRKKAIEADIEKISSLLKSITDSDGEDDSEEAS